MNLISLPQVVGICSQVSFDLQDNLLLMSLNYFQPKFKRNSSLDFFIQWTLSPLYLKSRVLYSENHSLYLCNNCLKILWVWNIQNPKTLKP